MKKIKIKFVDFFDGFDAHHNEFVDVLSQKYNVEICDRPDYLFYSCFGLEHLKYDCIRIFYTGECITPDFNECDYAIGFDRLSFGDRYVRIPLYNMFGYKAKYENLNKRSLIRQDSLYSRGFCSFVVSNCFANDLRVRFFEHLNAYRPVDSGGRYKNNVGGAIKDKIEFLAKYKFNIAFENCAYDGYATEKIVDAFAARTIPIYYGDPRIMEDFNPRSFVNVQGFPTIEAAIERVKEIDNNKELYLDMLNEPPIQSHVKFTTLQDFLFPIFDSSISVAWRRPHSQTVLSLQKMKLRHAFFETNIFKYYQKGINQLVRLKKGIMLTTNRSRKC